MGFHDYLRFVFALAFVLALMGILALVFKRSGLGKIAMGLGAGRRLTLIEVRTLDSRHKLALVKCDDREHLIVLGPQGHTVIDTNIPTPAQTPQTPQKTV